MNRTTFCLPTSSCPVETVMMIRSFIWPKVKSEHFFSGQGWVWLCVWEDWGWPENQPRRRGLIFIYLWIINHHLSCQVNRARYMPQNPSVIATKTPTSEVTPAFTQIHLQPVIMPPLFNPSSFMIFLLTSIQTHTGSSPRCLCSTPASRERRSRTPMASVSQSFVWEGTRRKGKHCKMIWTNWMTEAPAHQVRPVLEPKHERTSSLCKWWSDSLPLGHQWNCRG